MLEFIFIFLIAIIAGFIGPITGGGGLISVPALILLGLPPESAIASTRVGALGLWIAAITRYQREQKINWKLARPLIIMGIFGGYCGSELLLYLRDFDLNKIVALIMLAMLPLILLKARLKRKSNTPGKLRIIAGYILFSSVMVFSGFFSGGDGTLGIFVIVLCFGTTIVEANATRGPAWLAMGIIAVANYTSSGIIYPLHSAVLFLGMAIGANLGAKAVINKGELWVSKILSLVVVLLALKLLFIP